MTALAKRQLATFPRRVQDEEDVALDVLNSCFVRARKGGFPDLHDRTDLWRLLVKISARKVVDQKRLQMAGKRGGGRVRGESAFRSPSHDNRLAMEEQVAGVEPTPDMIVAIDEAVRGRLAMLDDELREVARMKLEGFTNDEIAESLGRVERTIQRKLKFIRRIWSESDGGG